MDYKRVQHLAYAQTHFASVFRFLMHEQKAHSTRKIMLRALFFILEVITLAVTIYKKATTSTNHT